ncbi:MAG: hypothetical protein A2Y06_04385 [Omnitrophica WOR_2 bacterium GWA2_37_7]|nr:MAG: hypothetical protein A2Y06_04385 [Omnitrophica WOR_2 bacterium GWA2_37_7]
MGTGASITTGTLFLRPTGDVSQGTLSIPNVIVRLSNVNDASITMTGNWSVNDLRIYGDASSDTEAEAMTLNTDTYNLTTAGYLSLGDTAGAFYGKIDLGSGTHTIGEYIDVEGNSNTWGFIDLGSSVVTVSGTVDFTRATVTPGSSTVTFVSTTLTNPLVSGGQTFNDLQINTATGSFQPVDNMDINGGFILTDGIFDLATNDPDMYIAHAVTFNGGTFTKGIGTVNFDGNLTYNDNVGGVDIGNLVIGGSPETTDLATDLTASTLTINYSDTLNTNGYDLDISGLIDINGTLDGTDDVAGDRTSIAAGDSWDMTGGTFTIADSSVTFDSVVTGNTITSDGKSFYDLLFNDGGGDSGGWSLADALITSNSMTVTATDSVNGVNFAGYDVTVGADFVLATAGEVTGSTSTINIGGDWNSAGGTFTYNASSVAFTGDGSIHPLAEAREFYHLSLAADGKASNYNAGDEHILLYGKLFLGGGTLTSTSENRCILMLGDDITPVVLTGANPTIGDICIVYSGDNQVITGMDYGLADLQVNDTYTFTFGGDVIAQEFSIAGFSAGTPTTVTTNGYNLTTDTLTFGHHTASTARYGVFNTDGSTVDINGDVNFDFDGADTLNMGTSTWFVSGDWDNTKISTVLVGASTVTFDGTAAQTVSSGSQTYYDLRVTNSSAFVTFDDAFETTDLTVTTPGASLKFADGLIYTVSGSLNIDGQYLGGEIYLESTPGATAFTFDTTTVVQNVYYVSVQDAHASSNDIYAWGAVNKGGTDSGDATPHWIFDALFPVSRAIFTGGADDGYDLGEYELEGGKGVWFGINF